MEKTVYYGVPSQDIAPQNLSDGWLIREVCKVARILYFVADADRRSEPEPARMRQHYGVLLSNGDLNGLLGELYQRSKTGSDECQAFVAVADKVVRKYGGFRDEGATPLESAYVNALPFFVRDGMITYQARRDPEIKGWRDVIDPYYESRIDPNQPLRLGQYLKTPDAPAPVEQRQCKLA